jgi:hypothetical protein
MPKTPPAPGSRPKGFAAPVVVEFVHERDTKNTTRFQEVVEDGKTPLVGTLYVNKSTGIAGNVRVRVTIEQIG